MNYSVSWEWLCWLNRRDKTMQPCSKGQQPSGHNRCGIHKVKVFHNEVDGAGRV
jgi:hypothetical protein